MRTVRRVVSIAVAGVCVAGMLSGCSKAPDQELAAVKTALQAAQTVEADKYLADRFANAKKALTAAEAEITKQNAAFVLVRNYSEATRILGIASSLAKALQTDAAGAKESAKAEVIAALAATQAQVKEARGEVKKAPKSQGKKTLTAMGVELTAADSSLAQAAAEINTGNYIGARQKIGEAQTKMRKVSDKLSTGGEAGLL